MFAVIYSFRRYKFITDYANYDVTRGVIAKLHSPFFAPFKESVTLNLAQRSSKVIDFGTNRKRVYIFVLVINNNLNPILHRFKDTVA